MITLRHLAVAAAALGLMAQAHATSSYSVTTPAGLLTVDNATAAGALSLQNLGPTAALHDVVTATVSAQPAGTMALSFASGDFEAGYFNPTPCTTGSCMGPTTPWIDNTTTPIILASSDAAVRQGGFNFAVTGHSALSSLLGGTSKSTYGWELTLTAINASGQRVTVLDEHRVYTVQANGAPSEDPTAGSLGTFSLTGHLAAGFDLNTLQAGLVIDPTTSLAGVCPLASDPTGTCTVRNASVANFANYTVFLDGLTITPSASAVPEPGTYALMGLGLVGLMIGTRQRRR